jgi:hypothetical protein
MRTAGSLGERWTRGDGSLGQRAMMARAVCLVMALGSIKGVTTAGTKFEGESCGSDSDCYGGKKCLGGRCCRFTVQNYDAESNQMGEYAYQNPHAGCTACSADGDQEPFFEFSVPYNRSLSPGTCKSCDAETKLISNSLVYSWENKTLEGFGTMMDVSQGGQGRCAVPCENDEYGSHGGSSFYCAPKWEAGRHCGGSSDSPFCASGLCGQGLGFREQVWMARAAVGTLTATVGRSAWADGAAGSPLTSTMVGTT